MPGDSLVVPGATKPLWRHSQRLHPVTLPKGLAAPESSGGSEGPQVTSRLMRTAARFPRMSGAQTGANSLSWTSAPPAAASAASESLGRQLVGAGAREGAGTEDYPRSTAAPSPPRAVEGALPGLLTLVANSGLALEAAGQVGRVGEHPGLAGGRLAGRRRAEGSVATGSSGAGELAGEVDGEGAQALLLVRLRAAPARLLFDEGVRRRRRGWRRSRRRGRAAQRTVRRRARGREVQHRRPLRSAAHGQGAAAAAPERRDGREQRVQVPQVGAHGRQLCPGRAAAPPVLQTFGAGLGHA